MTDSNDKIWFVYLEDHHEGPFTFNELKVKLAQGVIQKNQYIWRQGMADWVVMNEVPEMVGIDQVEENSEGPREEPAAEPSDGFQLAPLEEEPATNTTIKAVEETPEGSLRIDPKIVESAQSSEKQSEGTPENSSSGTQLSDASSKKNDLEEKSNVEGKTSEVSLTPITGFEEIKPASSHDTYKGPESSLGNLSDDTELRKMPEGLVSEAPEEKKGFLSRIFRRNQNKNHSDPQRVRSLLSILVLILLLGGGFYGFQKGLFPKSIHEPMVLAVDSASSLLSSGIERIPYLNKLLEGGHLPALKDVATEDFQRLKNAVSSDFKTKGPRVAVALSNKNVKSPSFYIVSNISGARFDIYLRGIPETLLNHVDFLQKKEIIQVENPTKSEAFQASDGKPLSRGEYQVIIVEAEKQSPEAANRIKLAQPKTSLPSFLPQGKRIFVSQRYFLGGENDENYRARLKAFHKKLKERSDKELMEVKQFGVTLVSQFNATVKKFSNVRKKRNRRTRAKEWTDFQRNWLQLNSQLEQSFNQWTSEAIQNDFYHGNLYRMTKDAGAALSNVHQLQDEFVKKDQSGVKREKDLAKAILNARNSIRTLLSNLKKVEKTPLSPSGMPSRIEN